MLGHAVFYESSIRKYVTIFGNFFNEISIDRVTETGAFLSSFKVPVSYGPKQKYLARLTANPDLDRDRHQIILPRMAFEMTDISFDQGRGLNKLNVLRQSNSPSTDATRWMPRPWNFTFQLSILVLNAEDGTRIVEQILPFFTPEYVVSAKLLNDFDQLFDIAISLEDVSVEDIYDGDFETRRTLTWNLNFTLKGWLFGPPKTKGLIRTINTNLFNTMDLSASRAEQVNVELGIKGQKNVVPGTVTPADDFAGVPTIKN